MRIVFIIYFDIYINNQSQTPRLRIGVRVAVAVAVSAGGKEAPQGSVQVCQECVHIHILWPVIVYMYCSEFMPSHMFCA